MTLLEENIAIYGDIYRVKLEVDGNPVGVEISELYEYLLKRIEELQNEVE